MRLWYPGVDGAIPSLGGRSNLPSNGSSILHNSKRKLVDGAIV